MNQVSILLSSDPINSPLLKQHFHTHTCSLLKRHQNNQRYIHQVKQSNGRCLEFFPGVIKSRELAIHGLSQCGSYLSKCSEQLRSDELIVSIAIQSDGLALQFASDELRGRKEIVMKAVGQNGMALKYISTQSDSVSLMNDWQVVKKAILTTPIVLLEIDGKCELLSDTSLVLELIRENPTIFKFLNKQMKSDRQIQLQILSTDGKYLEHFNEEMLPCHDRELVHLALRNSKLAYPYIEKSLRNEIALEMGDFTYVEKVSRIQIGDYALLTSNQIPCEIYSIEKDYNSSKCGPSFKINISGRSLTAQSIGNNSSPIFMTYFASVSNLSALICPFVYRIKCQLMGLSGETLILKSLSNEFNVKLFPFTKHSIPESILLDPSEIYGGDSIIYLEIIQVMGEQKIVSITHHNKLKVCSSLLLVPETKH